MVQGTLFLNPRLMAFSFFLSSSVAALIFTVGQSQRHLQGAVGHLLAHQSVGNVWRNAVCELTRLGSLGSRWLLPLVCGEGLGEEGEHGGSL